MRQPVPAPKRTSAAIVALWCLASSAWAAGSFDDWAFLQEFEVDAAGLVKIGLPADTLDCARADLGDLRLVDPQGTETPWWIEQPRPQSARRVPVRSFKLTLAEGATVAVVETGTSELLDGVILQTPTSAFVKAVQVEGGQATNHWTLIASGLPLFRQGEGRAEQLELPLPRGAWRYLRLTLDDRTSAPVPITGGELRVAAPPSTPTEPVSVRVLGREEELSETRLTLDLGAARLPLAEIELITPEPLFRRSIRLVARQIEGITIQEKELARGTIQRVASTDPTSQAAVKWTLDMRAPHRELLLRIENGDSPPLRLDDVRVRRWPVNLGFWAAAPGRYTIYTGNPVCPPPQYDQPDATLDLGRTPVTTVQFTPPTPNAGHRPGAILPQVDELAGPLELDGWSYRKPVGIESAGVQALELDLEVLAHTQPGHGDIRLLLGDRQVPYILERRSVLRALKPVVRPADDPDQPRRSRWQIQLPHANLPVTRLACSSATALFRREVVVFEEPQDSRGGRYRRQLGHARWVQSPERPAAPLTLELEASPLTDMLYLETDNEDNPPIQLSGFELAYPVVRLLFKCRPGVGLFLYYGNPRAAVPQYDLSLVAAQIVAVDRVPAFLGRAEALQSGGWTTTAMKGRGGVVFWGALVLVVVGLLFVIARLVPKPPPPPSAPS